MELVDVCITFDVDQVEHTTGGSLVDEMADAVPRIREIFAGNPDWTATWFVRLDGQMEARYGAPDFLFRRYAESIATLRAHGHEIGWHPHCYTRRGCEWKQNTCIDEVVAELELYGPIARALDLRCVRLGWGFHTNETMQLIAEMGFLVDSSAIPRPQYSWEDTVRDWRGAPSRPYRPSLADYRRPGAPAASIVEVPMSTTLVRAPYDRGPVLRYLNPAYRSEIWQTSLERWLQSERHLVTVTHPYEIVPRDQTHALLAFEPAVFERNLKSIRSSAHRMGATVDFTTISGFADRHRSL